MKTRQLAIPTTLIALALALSTPVAPANRGAATAESPFADPGDRFRDSTGTWRGIWAFENVNLLSMVPGERPLQRRRTVVVRDGIIQSIEPARSAKIPRRAQVIDGKGRFLLPGLMDTHVHIWMGDGRYPGFDETDLWTLFLANGITTVVEMVGATPFNTPRLFLFDWRDDVAEGRTVGPSLFVASPRFRDNYQGDFATIDAKVEEYARLGFDFIKVHAPNRLPNYLRLFERAARHGIRPIGHPPYRSPDVPIETVLELQTMVSHTQLLMYQYLGRIGAVNLTDAQMDDLARQLVDAGTLLQPTPATTGILYWYLLDDRWNRTLNEGWLKYFPPSLRASWVEENEIRSGNRQPETAKVFWDAVVKQSRKISAAGVPMIAGSDSGGLDLTPHGFFFHEELASLERDVGLTTWQTLEAATRNAAEFLRVGDEVGTIEIGKRADLLLLERNPLRKIRRTRSIAGVMVRGKWIPKARLETALADLAARMNTSTASAGKTAMAERHLDCHPPLENRSIGR